MTTEEAGMEVCSTPNACPLARHPAPARAGAAFDAVRLDFRKNEQRPPECLRINPDCRASVQGALQGKKASLTPQLPEAGAADRAYA